MSIKRLVCLMPVLCVLAITGCSKNVHVTGRVTFADGTPLKIGQVVFTNDEYMGRSDVDKNGEYSIHSARRNDGLRKGSYKAYLTSVFVFEEAKETPDKLQAYRFDKPVATVDPKYMNPETSGWAFDIKKKSRIDLVVYPPGEAPEDQESGEAEK